jgi:hypothetical protein
VIIGVNVCSHHDIPYLIAAFYRMFRERLQDNVVAFA